VGSDDDGRGDELGVGERQDGRNCARAEGMRGQREDRRGWGSGGEKTTLKER
jgi:hypothetical protein